MNMIANSMDMAKAEPSYCFHCHTPLPSVGSVHAEVDDQSCSFCCAGCAAA
ncbi:MAG: heavy metal translocating P-type ATPase metal-binding domain-containing protein, partial [Granulosicoccaceae bacterium]